MGHFEQFKKYVHWLAMHMEYVNDVLISESLIIYGMFFIFLKLHHFEPAGTTHMFYIMQFWLEYIKDDDHSFLFMYHNPILFTYKASQMRV